MHAGPRCISFYVSCDVLNQAQLTLEELNLTIDSALKLILVRLAYEGAPRSYSPAEDTDARLREHVRIALLAVPQSATTSATRCAQPMTETAPVSGK